MALFIYINFLSDRYFRKGRKIMLIYKKLFKERKSILTSLVIYLVLQIK